MGCLHGRFPFLLFLSLFLSFPSFSLRPQSVGAYPILLFVMSFLMFKMSISVFLKSSRVILGRIG